MCCKCEGREEGCPICEPFLSDDAAIEKICDYCEKSDHNCPLCCQCEMENREEGCPTCEPLSDEEDYEQGRSTP